MKAQNLKTYLYSISRRDIPLAQQSVQAAHAAIEHAYLFGRPVDDHPSYIHLTVHDKSELELLRTRLRDAGVQTAEFHEPYKDFGLTAISACLNEDQRDLLKGLPLWRLPTQNLT